MRSKITINAANGSIEQQYRTAFCVLQHTYAQQLRTTQLLMWTAGCRSMLLWNVWGEGLCARDGGGNVSGQERCISYSYFSVVGHLVHFFALFVVLSCCDVLFLAVYTLSDGKLSLMEICWSQCVLITSSPLKNISAPPHVALRPITCVCGVFFSTARLFCEHS